MSLSCVNSLRVMCSLRELAHTPLMLSIMILAYRGQSASDVPDFDDLESQRQHLFDVYVQRMFDRRVGDAPYTQDETKHYLRWLAGQMQEHILSVFHIEDLQPTWLANREAIQQFPLRIRQMGSIYLSIAWIIALGIFYLVADVSSLAGLPFAIISVTITATIYVFMLTSERTLSDAGQGRWRDYIPVSLAIGVTFSILLVSTQPIGDVLVLFP
jgi:cellulose synthase/poly-beta-1,6-N-acetylglucosamine synthase-like glycosyltransferase